jgi:hypothetical protein
MRSFPHLFQAIPLLLVGDIRAVADPRMGDHYDAVSVEAFCTLALACINKNPKRRPTITEVRNRLERIAEGLLITSSSSGSEGREMYSRTPSGDAELVQRVTPNPGTFSESDFYKRGLEYTDTNRSDAGTSHDPDFAYSAWSGPVTELQGR